MLKLPSPRLLPLTIVALAALLGIKSAELVHAAIDTAQTAGAVLVPLAHAEVPAVSKPVKPALKSPSTDVPACAPANGPGADERSLLSDLRARSKALDQRDVTLTRREMVLHAAEGRLAARITELSGLQKKLEALDAARRQREEANWQGLVKVYEVMPPRDAATIFNNLEMPVLLQVLDRMKDRKAAPILAAMQPDRARLATQKLAEMRTRQTSMASVTPGN